MWQDKKVDINTETALEGAYAEPPGKYRVYDGVRFYNIHQLHCFADATHALRMESTSKAAPQKSQEPAAWLEYAKKKPSLRRLVFTKTSDKELKAAGWIAEPLYTQAPS